MDPTIGQSKKAQMEHNILSEETSKENYLEGAVEPETTVESSSTTNDTLAQIKRRENIQFAALCIPLFLAGYNDGNTRHDYCTGIDR